MKKIRIASGAGYAGDRIEPAIDVMKNGDIDYIAFECLAERTIAIAQSEKLKNPDKGYNNLLEERFNEILPICSEKKIKVITNMGAANPLAAVKKIKEMPKQDLAAAVSKKGVLFFYITDFNRGTKEPRLRVIFADSNIFKNPCDFWQDIKTSGAISDEGGVKFVNSKKPEKILYRLIKMITKPNDLILDFYLGSGTTAAVAHKMGRRYIGIEQMDYIENIAVK